MEPLRSEEAGQLLARIPPIWWDHIITLLGTGLRFGETCSGTSTKAR
jgi:hypothetical protein